jgi:hypothetical protein
MVRADQERVHAGEVDLDSSPGASVCAEDQGKGGERTVHFDVVVETRQLGGEEAEQ